MEDFSIYFTVIVTDSNGNTVDEIPPRFYSDEIIHMICEETATLLKMEES